MTSKRFKIIIITSILMLFLFLVVFDVLFLETSSIQEPLNGRLSDASSKAIDLITELTKLFISFGIGILGGLFFFIKDQTLKLGRIDFLIILLCAIFSMLSIYFGHMIYITFSNMLANDFIDFFSKPIVWAIRLQYLFLLFSICTFLYFIYKTNRQIQALKEKK